MAPVTWFRWRFATERTADRFSITLRSVVRRFAIDDRSLRGTWLSLLTVSQPFQPCSGSEISFPPKMTGNDGNDNAKTVLLP